MDCLIWVTGLLVDDTPNTMSWAYNIVQIPIQRTMVGLFCFEYVAHDLSEMLWQLNTYASGVQHGYNSKI